jgi:hypothetical protein
MLSEKYRGLVPEKSGTGALEEVRRYIERPGADKFVVETARKLYETAVPALDKEYKSPGGNFCIHYTLSGQNAVDNASRYVPGISKAGVPKYIRLIGETLDNVSETCKARGFRLPVTDAGSNKMDVYVYNLKNIWLYQLGKDP